MPPVNQYFNNFTYSREQDLLEDLVIESIKIYGYPVRYLPRTVVRDDPLFAEDTLSTFDNAVEMEMYVKNIEGFEGEGDFLSRFGLQIRDEITFTIARKRFDQAKSEKLTTEVGYNLLLESADTESPSRQYLDEPYVGDSIQLESGTSENYSITNNRPTEGDLIYFPLTGKVYEIMHVEHEAVFYQLGRLYTYDIRCELFEYSSERFETGNTEIDAIETAQSLDILFYELLLESGDKLLKEDGGSFINESFRIEDIQPTANNEFFQSNEDISFPGDDIIDFSETNPFSEADRY